jgi:hypothetical protein
MVAYDHIRTSMKTEEEINGKATADFADTAAKR